MGKPVVVVMGVSGCGKTTIGSLLSARTGWPFIDADVLHPIASLEKMRAGIPLTDEDRWPWLEEVAESIGEYGALGEPAVVACSALKRSYRDLLREADPDLRIVHLSGERELLEKRLAHRHGHFFPRQLLESQLAAYEPPTPDENPIVVSIGLSPGEAVDTIMGALDR